MDVAKLKLLFLASHPKNSGEIQLEGDLHSLQRAIDTTRSEERFWLRFLWGPSPADLIDNLSSFKPDIVHFSGHGRQATGDSDSAIVLTGRASEAAVLSEQKLLSLFRGLREDRPQLLFLASCWGLDIARAATSFVKCAVGCPQNLNDKVAVGFIHGFYSAIASGRSLRDAYNIGQAGIPDGTPFDRSPMIECSPDVDPSNLILLAKQPPKDQGLNEIQRLLDMGLFSEAAFRADAATKSAPTEGCLLYYLALARMNGRAPRALISLDEAKGIESLLERSLRISAVLEVDSPGTSLGSWQGCAQLLWAWIKEDLYARNGFLGGEGPHFEFLLQKAVESRPVRSELTRLSRVIPGGETSRARAFLDYLLTQAIS